MLDFVVSGTQILLVSSPLDIDGAVLWLDADDYSTITESSGKVSQWNDKSTSGFNVSQPTTAEKPTYLASGMNGRGTIRFVRSNVESLGASSVPLNANAESTTFMVYTRASEEHLPVFVRGQGVAGKVFGYASNFGVSNKAGYFWGWNNDYAVTSTDAITLNTTYLSTLTYNGDTGLKHWLDGDLTFNGTIGAVGSATSEFRVGRWFSSEHGYYGNISEIIIYDSELSNNDRQKVENYLKTKWGID